MTTASSSVNTLLLRRPLRSSTATTSSLAAVAPISSSLLPSGAHHARPRRAPRLTSNLLRGARVLVRATGYDDELGFDPKPEESAAGGNVAVADDEAPVPAVGSETAKLKLDLKEKLYGTDRGLNASNEVKAEIVELITLLEANNPTPAPTEAITLLNGKWILAYTSFLPLFPLLAVGRVPKIVKVEEISQTIDSEAFTVQNSVQFVGPLATTSLTTNAKFDVRSPKRVQIKFEEGIIGTPQLTDLIVLPEKVEVFGQNIDLSPFKGVFTSIQDAASSVAKTISGQPPIKFPITDSLPQGWLLTTYLDDELRISRNDAGGVFVLIKEGSSLLE